MLKMDKDKFKSYLRTIKELILDEQKIVTYISISRELCIHVNEAKSLLKQVIEDIRRSVPKTDICVCYMISGLLKDNSACTTVCSEADVEALRSTLKIKFFEHVYCVSLGVQAVDHAALAAINRLEDFPLCTGLIKSGKCTKRTDEEISNLKYKTPSIPEASHSNLAKRNNAQKSKELLNKGHEVVKKVEVKTEPIPKSKTPSPKKDAATNNNKPNNKNNVSKPAARGIAGFFNKSNGISAQIKTTKIKEEISDDKVVVKLENEIKVKEEEEPTKTVTIDTKHKKREPTNSTDTTKKLETDNKTKKTTNGNLKQIKKNAKVDKKRKRVLHVSDSESEAEADPFADEEKMVVDQESEDEIPPTPSINTVKITSGIVNPKKRRKIVDKTYTDEDGYILTKKEEVYESCSDNENDTNKEEKIQEKENMKQVIHVKNETSPKENGKAKKKKVSPPQKGKQSTLTSFFKKV